MNIIELNNVGVTYPNGQVALEGAIQAVLEVKDADWQCCWE